MTSLFDILSLTPIYRDFKQELLIYTPSGRGRERQTEKKGEKERKEGPVRERQGGWERRESMEGVSHLREERT